MTTAAWEHFEHQADIGVRGIGADKGEAFAQAAVALTAVLVDPKQVVAREPFEVECEAADDALLLVDWLNTVIYEMAAKKMLFSRFDVWVETPNLRARIWGEKINSRKHHPAVEVKGATYHEADVRQRKDGAWVAQCVVDV